MGRLKQLPAELENGIFLKLMKLAEIAMLTPKEQDVYNESLKNYRDMRGAYLAATEEGEAKGEVRRAKAIAEKMRAAGENI